MKALARRALAYLARFGLAFALALLVYFTAALVGACWPRNADFTSAPRGVRVWVVASPIHTDLIVPARNEIFDWHALVSPADGRTPNPINDHVAVGWGDRKFYLETRTWRDIKLSNVLSAFCGLDATAMHVEWCSGALQEGPRCRSVVLTNQQYDALCKYMSASFTRDSTDKAVKIDFPGYYETDAFYEAQGRYSAYRTCNTWTGQALAAGGVRVGAWTPTTWGVLWQLPAASP